MTAIKGFFHHTACFITNAQATRNCFSCGGSGNVYRMRYTATCPRCKGKGRIRT